MGGAIEDDIRVRRTSIEPACIKIVRFKNKMVARKNGGTN